MFSENGWVLRIKTKFKQSLIRFKSFTHLSFRYTSLCIRKERAQRLDVIHSQIVVCISNWLFYASQQEQKHVKAQNYHIQEILSLVTVYVVLRLSRISVFGWVTVKKIVWSSPTRVYLHPWYCHTLSTLSVFKER